MSKCYIGLLANIFVTHYLLPFHLSLFIFILYAVVLHFRELSNIALTTIGFFCESEFFWERFSQENLLE